MIDKITTYMFKLWRLNALALIAISLACHIYWKSKSSFYYFVVCESTSISCIGLGSLGLHKSRPVFSEKITNVTHLRSNLRKYVPKNPFGPFLWLSCSCQGKLRGLFWPKVVADFVGPAQKPKLHAGGFIWDW